MASRLKPLGWHPSADAIQLQQWPRIAGSGRQDGAFAVMFIPLLMVIIGFCGLAIDIGFVYNRKVDVQGLAKAAALAAARELNGTRPASLRPGTLQEMPPRRCGTKISIPACRSYGTTRR